VFLVDIDIFVQPAADSNKDHGNTHHSGSFIKDIACTQSTRQFKDDTVSSVLSCPLACVCDNGKLITEFLQQLFQ
jgi:hypothetical protein